MLGKRVKINGGVFHIGQNLSGLTGTIVIDLYDTRYIIELDEESSKKLDKDYEGFCEREGMDYNVLTLRLGLDFILIK
jgi:hypothetical protein